MEEKIKHLEFIQQSISRMSNNSFLLKGWAVTVISGLIAFSQSQTTFSISTLSLLICLLFWMVDAYYLSLERRFIALYNSVRLAKGGVDFNLDITAYNTGKRKWLNTAFSTSLLLFYGSLFLVDLGISLLPITGWAIVK